MSNPSEQISKPKHEGKYPDRDIDCQEAVVGAMMDLIEKAENAGWTAREAAAAVYAVSRGFVLEASGREPNG